MYKVIFNDVEVEFADLNSAMEHAKLINEFVSIKGGEFEIVGRFGVDEVTDPNYDGWISRKQGV
jgi:hypothetical protein